MALGALIAAYHEDEAGGLRALLPLAGRTLLEYQARCAAAAGAAPIVVVVDGVPPALDAALGRLRDEGVVVVPVANGQDAAARFEPGTAVLQLADGLAPAMSLVQRMAASGQRAVATVPDDERHEQFERIDRDHRWAGLAMVDGATLASTTAMLGDWDLQSTLLRRTLQAGAVQVPAVGAEPPFLAHAAADPHSFDRHLVAASRGARRDWPSRYLLPPAEEFATEQLMRSPVRPQWLIHAALALVLTAGLLFTRGYLWAGLALLLVSTPLHAIADRLATLRLQPLPARMLSRRLHWPAAGLALLGLSWFESRHGGGWGAIAAGLSAGAFAQALVTERHGWDVPGEQWLFGFAPAVFTAVPFAVAGWWSGALAALAVYAAGSFFLVQHVVHRIARG